MKTPLTHRVGYMLLAVLLGLGLGACSSDNPTEPEPPQPQPPVLRDTTAPASVFDLAPDSVIEGTAYLAWTATGDDGDTGTAASYDLRYGTSAAMLTNDWSSATAAAGLPAPRAAGLGETYQLTGLAPNITHYIGIKAADDSANVSSLSNIVTAFWTDRLGLELADVQTGDCGTVAVPLTVINFETVSGLTMNIGYEPAQVTFDSISSVFGDDAMVNATGGVISILWADMSMTSPITIDDNSILVTLHFSDLAGTSPLTFEPGTKVVDPDGIYFDVDLYDGSLSCSGK